MNTAAEKHTPAGIRILREFVEAEQTGRLVHLKNNLDGSSAGAGLPLRAGDGGHLAAAQKLEKAGAVRLVGRRHRRFVIITDCGRAAIAKATA